MPLDYSGQNLRGRSFRGLDLTGANFSYADIRSADFSGAKLRGANFSHAKAGLQKRWAIILVLISWAVAGLLGYISAYAGVIVGNLLPYTYFRYSNAGVVALIVFTLFSLLVLDKGLEAALGFLAGTVLIVVGAAAAGAAIFESGAILTEDMARAVASSAAAGAVSATGAVAGAIAVTVAGTMAVTVVGIVAVAVAWVVGVGLAVSVVRIGVVEMAIAGATVSAGLSAYVSWRALVGDSKYAFVQKIAVAFAAFRGTSFRSSDLTDANFTGATLKSTDFRKAILTRTYCWFSILVRRLLRRGNFTSTLDLKKQILNFIDYFNRTLAKPFVWKFLGYPIKNAQQ